MQVFLKFGIVACTVLSLLKLHVTAFVPQEEPFSHVSSFVSNVLKNPDYKRVTHKESIKFRLPHHLVPESYQVTIAPLLDDDPDVGAQFTAPGSVTIRLNCTETTKQIFVHFHLLTIQNASVTVKDVGSDTNLDIEGLAVDAGKDFFIITMKNDLITSRAYDVFMEFVAPVQTNSYFGLYLASYIDESGEEKRLAVTQFQSVFAREMFPCLDEPHLKAEFAMTIVRKANYTALANTDVKSSEPALGYPDGWIKDTFHTTVKMSTYLVAILVSDFTNETASKDLYPKSVRVWGEKDKIGRGDGIYGANITANLLSHFESYFDLPYPMSKVDSAGVPQFAAGGMENWGLITYRPEYIMYRENETTERERYIIGSLTTHEVIHQWFGNLVTCEWWHYLWLNEGWATWGEYLGAFAVTPEFHPFMWALNEIVHTSMIVDAGESSHPVVNNAEGPDEIESYFTRITYEKAGSLIRMMDGFLSWETLHKGLKSYIHGNLYGAVTQDDLFDYLTRAAREDGTLDPTLTVKDVMDTWTLQTGFPLVRVGRLSDSQLLISQERFGSSSRQGYDDRLNPDDRWFVPITMTTSDKPSLPTLVPEFWIPKNVSMKVVPVDTSMNKWVFVNVKATGYYRTMYDTSLLARLVAQLNLNAQIFHHSSRSQLLNDYFTFAFNDYSSLESALSLTEYMKNENQYTVWEVIFIHMRKALYLFFSTDPDTHRFSKYFLPRLTGALNAIGIRQTPGEKGLNVIFRASLLDWACSMASPECTEYANDLFQQWKSHPEVNPIPVDLRTVMLCSMVRYSDEAFDFMFAKYRLDSGRLWLNAMACSNSDEKLTAYIGMPLVPGSGLRQQDYIYALQRIAIVGGLNARKLLMKALQTDTALYVQTVGEGTPKFIADLIASLTTRYFADEELQDVITFSGRLIAEYPDPEPGFWPNTLKTAQDTIRGNMAWAGKYYRSMQTWFDTHE